jgi:WD40 repeat protein
LTRRGRSARFSPDGTKVIIFSDNEPVRLEDLGDRNRATVVLGPNGKVRTAQFSPAGRLVAAGRDDGSVQLWDASGKPIDSWPVHAAWVLSLAFSRDGRRIVTGSMDGTAGLSDTALRKRTTVLAGHKDRVWNAVFNADGSRVGTTSSDATIRLWDGATGKELVVLDLHHWFERSPEIRQISLTADNRTIATLGSDGVARLWYVFPSTPALIAYAQKIVQNQQLTADERRRFFLNDSPPK